MGLSNLENDYRYEGDKSKSTLAIVPDNYTSKLTRIGIM